MAIQGSLEEAPLPDVIQLLSLGRKTGCLTLVERDMEGEICLAEGRICHAAVFGRRDRLGDMLVRTGRITQEELDNAIAEQHGGGRRVSQALMDSGQVERTELEQFVRRQVEEAVYYMFTWRTGSFAFTATGEPKHQDVPVSIDPEGLLLEGARRVDEWSLIEKRIPSLALVFRLDRARLDATRPALTREQTQIIPLIDGTRDVHALIELTGMAEFTVGKALFGLITAGFAQRVERRSSMRHLDYREMLAYVVKEAEFADPEERRAAARHIADCSTCTQRLKTIHIRRTGGLPVVTASAESQAPPAAPDVPAVVPPAAQPQAPDGIERRVGDRRIGQERREVERRRGQRRVARSPDWERPGRERRSGRDRRGESRRIAERRIGTATEWQRASTARAIPVPPRPRGPERRSTGPRRAPPPGAGPEPTRRTTGGFHRLPYDERHEPTPAAAPEDRRPEPPAAPAAAEPRVEVAPRTPRRAPPGPRAEPPVEVTPAPAPKARRSRSDPEIPDPPAEPPVDAVAAPSVAAEEEQDTAEPSAVPDSGPAPSQHPGRTTDIEWVVSPGEANHLLRTSRVGLAAAGSGEVAAGLPAPVEQEPGVEPAPGEAGRPMSRLPAERPKGAGPALVGRERLRAPAARPAPRRVSAPVRAAASRPARRAPWARWLGLATAFAAVAGIVWVVRPLLQPIEPSPRVSGAPEATSSAAAPPAIPPTTATTPGAPAASEAAPPAGAEPETQAARGQAPPATTLASVPHAEPARAARPPAREAVRPGGPPPAPVPTTGVLRGVVRDARTGTALAGAQVTIPGTAFAATTDAAGGFALASVPAGRLAVAASMDGRVPERREVILEGGATALVDFALAEPPPPPAPEPAPPPARPAVAPVAREPDTELADGGWVVSDAAAAVAKLRGGLATIPDLWIESIAFSENGSRARVRIALLTPDGDRIVLTETRSSAPALGTPRVTALRVIAATEAYPVTTGTASFGSLLVTAKTSLPGDTLRALLAKLAPLE